MCFYTIDHVHVRIGPYFGRQEPLFAGGGGEGEKLEAVLGKSCHLLCSMAKHATL